MLTETKAAEVGRLWFQVERPVLAYNFGLQGYEGSSSFPSKEPFSTTLVQQVLL